MGPSDLDSGWSVSLWANPFLMTRQESFRKTCTFYNEKSFPIQILSIYQFKIIKAHILGIYMIV